MSGMAVLIVVLIALVLIVWGLADFSQSWAAAKQAQAAIEVGKAARIASLGSTLAVAAIVLLVVALLIVLLYALYLRLKLERVQLQHSRRWEPGPNARWRKQAPKANPAPALPQTAGTDAIQALVQLQALRLLQEMRPVSLPAPPPIEPVEGAGGEDEDDLPEGWLG